VTEVNNKEVVVLQHVKSPGWDRQTQKKKAEVLHVAAGRQPEAASKCWARKLDEIGRCRSHQKVPSM
jgi:hypothetical protein